jgi:DNA-3-methyladenine glycosylase
MREASRPAGRSFYQVDASTLARRLLGCALIRKLDTGESVGGVIVETEAYIGVQDGASHAFGGRRTAKNEAIYGPPGTAYVYFTYGMHHCFNIVCGEVDEPVAVLVRAIWPTVGIERMQALRGRDKLGDLASGPGKLCKALAIDRALNGSSLVLPPGKAKTASAAAALVVLIGEPVAERDVDRTARIGISSAGAWTRRRLRWVVKDPSRLGLSKPRVKG